MIISQYIADGKSFGLKRASVEKSETMCIRLWLPRSYGAATVFLSLHLDGVDDYAGYELQWMDRVDDLDLYETELTLHYVGLYWFSFELSGDGKMAWSRFENRRLTFTDHYDHKNETQITVYEQSYQEPSYLRGGVIYQIFPDRFYRGSDSRPMRRICEQDEVKSKYALRAYGEGYDNHLERSIVLREDWGGEPIWWFDSHNEMLNNDFFGGNLQGIIEKLPYLEELGVTCIYLGPIFEAYSNHRYDTGDYMKIDALVGDEETFVKLCKEAKKRGMAVMLDGVFNHTGADSKYFNKYGTYGSKGVWQGDETYSDWFTVENGKYESWWGIETLPTVKKNSLSHHEYLFGENGVIRKWIRLGASGWRLDVVDELPTDVLRALTAAAKAEKEDAVVLGEVWEDASNKIAYSTRRSYFQGRELDSVMNYPWKNAVLSYIRDGNADGLAQRIDEICCNYPPHVLHNLMNLISTHDSVRALTALAGKNLTSASREEMSKTWLSEPEYAHGIRLMRLAVTLQMTLPGVPSIYYGDEIGMEGYIDPFNRRCFSWDKIDRNLFTYYLQMTKMRKEYRRFFAHADCSVIEALDGVFAMVRRFEKTTLLVVINRSMGDITRSLKGSWKNLLTGEVYRGSRATITLDKEYGCLILIGKQTADDIEWEEI